MPLEGSSPLEGLPALDQVRYQLLKISTPSLLPETVLPSAIAYVVYPLLKRGEDGFTAQFLNTVYHKAVRVGAASHVYLAYDTYKRLSDASVYRYIMKGVSCLLCHPKQIFTIPGPLSAHLQIMFIHGVRLPLTQLIRARLSQEPLQVVNQQNALPCQFLKISPQRRHVRLVVLVLVKRNHGYVFEAQVIKHHTVEPVILTETAGSVGGSHEKGATAAVEVIVGGLLNDVPSGKDCGVTLLA